jgi:hypothetical protein
MSEKIKLTSAALDEANNNIVLRGVVTPQSLKLIKVDDYQREALPLTSLSSLIHALKSPAASKVPDITLGTRSGNYDEEKGGTFYLVPETYVIDGLQRISAARHLIESGAFDSPKLGAVVYFNSTRESERDLFHILNTSRVRLSPNVLLRNMKDTNPAINMLYSLCLDSTFPLYERVSWQQRMRRSELLTARTFIQVSAILHAMFQRGARDHCVNNLGPALVKIMGSTGRKSMRDNMVTFFNTVDAAWGIRNVTYKEGATYLHQNFLSTLAEVFSKHSTFWDDRKLVVSADQRRKLASFPIKDPQVIGLASGGHTAGRHFLLELIIRHMNSGRRTGRLKPFREIAMSRGEAA